MNATCCEKKLILFVGRNDAVVFHARTYALRRIIIRFALCADVRFDEEDTFFGNDRSSRADGLAIPTSGADIGYNLHGHCTFLFFFSIENRPDPVADGTGQAKPSNDCVLPQANSV